tara:strand:+ start:35 stop:307 length:273 start_codon:yes stop_codon:yes gene_type:complete
MNNKILGTLTTTKYELKEGTKSVFLEVGQVSGAFKESNYNNIVESAPFFRRLGGSETLSRCYTSQGYKVYKMVSKSPCKTMKTIREFNWS